jgi:ABC-type spermidine/putrescine transport system permease subunit II
MLLAHDGLPHLSDGLRSRAARAELAWSLAYASSAAVLANLMAGAALRRRWALVFGVPGLAGSLIVALAFRLACPPALLDSPLATIAALVVWLLPFALLVRHALARDPARHDWHAAELLGALDAQRARAAERLRRDLSSQGHVWALAILVPLALQDVVIGSVLAPPHATPLTVRLHNLAHYGHSHTVSAQLLLLMLAGILPLGVVALAACWSGREFGRRSRAARTGGGSPQGR